MNSNLAGSYYLTGDIDCSATSSWNSGAGFVPIGNSSTKFTGSFDGQNYKITGLYRNTGSNYQGLFGYINGAIIQNVGLESLSLTGNDYIGGLVGYSAGVSSLTNSYVKGSVVSLGGGDDYAGGLVGYAAETLTISNCYTDIDIFGGWQVGGLVGYTKGTTIINSYSNCKLNGDDKIGGLIGRATSSTIISGCYSSGTIKSGGTGDSWTGGLVGLLESSLISNSYSTAKATDTKYVGGLTGKASSSTINNSYSVGAVSGSSYLGGLVGNSSSTTITVSYWDTQTSGQSSSSGGTGKTTAEMKTQSTFAGWDFSTVWYMPSSGDYPKLKWQLPTCTGCAVLNGDICVAGSSCSGELPTCSVSGDNGICVCNSGSCDDGRQCSGTTCVNCASSDGCGACNCGTSEKPTGTGSCLITNACCAGECNVATGTDSCSYSDALCPDSACNRTTLACCATSLPYWRSSACKACSTTSGLSGACTTQGMECNNNYNCVVCSANSQCTCDVGDVADGSGNCVTPACSSDADCGIDQCLNPNNYNAFCSDCSSYNQIWYQTSCANCPADAVYSSGVCLCNDGKTWNRSTNSCFERGITTSSGDFIDLKRNSSNSAGGRYERIKNRMTRIKTKILDGAGEK